MIADLVPAVQQADIWSIGIILYTILYGRYPFNTNDPDHQRQFINAQYALPQDVNVSHIAVCAMCCLTCSQPEAAGSYSCHVQSAPSDITQLIR